MFGFHHLVFFGFSCVTCEIENSDLRPVNWDARKRKLRPEKCVRVYCGLLKDVLFTVRRYNVIGRICREEKKLACGGTFLSRITKIIPRIRMVFRLHCKYYYTSNSLSLFWLAESVQWIFEISACDVISADDTITRQGHSRSRVIMSSSRALCCLPSVKKQKHDFHFFFPSVYNKTIIRFGFWDIVCF